MADIQIPREAVDAAARALGNHIELDFDVLPADEQHQAREAAVAALNAATPLLSAVAHAKVAAKLNELADQITGVYKCAGCNDRIDVANHSAQLVRDFAHELKAGVDEPAQSAEPRDLIDPIAAALSLLDRFHTPGDRGRTLALISDLRQILAGA